LQLVNLQSDKEFASHRLNRDTWGNPTLQDIIKGNFVFIQVTLTRILKVWVVAYPR